MFRTVFYFLASESLLWLLLNCLPSASVSFGIVKAASNVNEFNQDDLQNQTVGELYGTAKTQALLSDKDTKNKTLTLRIMVVEPQPVHISYHSLWMILIVIAGN